MKSRKERKKWKRDPPLRVWTRKPRKGERKLMKKVRTV
jgi:hypothetical protein